MKVVKLRTEDEIKRNLPALEKDIIGKKTIFFIVTAEWCGHCHATKPEWEKSKAEFKQHDNVTMVDVDEKAYQYLTRNEPNRAFSQILYNSVSGYPTLMCVKTRDGMIDPKPFDKSQRTKEMITEWIHDNIKKPRVNKTTPKVQDKPVVRKNVAAKKPTTKTGGEAATTKKTTVKKQTKPKTRPTTASKKRATLAKPKPATKPKPKRKA